MLGKDSPLNPGHELLEWVVEAQLRHWISLDDDGQVLYLGCISLMMPLSEQLFLLFGHTTQTTAIFFS